MIVLHGVATVRRISDQFKYFHLSFSFVTVDDTCGAYDGSCDNSSILSTTLIAVIIIGSIFFFIICLTCCIQSHQRQQQQRMHTAYMNSNGLVVTNPYQQQIPQGPVRIVHARPFYNVGSASPHQQYLSLYEEPPPSYESVAANLPPVHKPSEAPPTPTVQ
jgi:hypothetical protein